VEQNVRGALMISDRVLVMEQGRKFMEGTAADIRDDPRIRQAYLGGNIDRSAEGPGEAVPAPPPKPHAAEDSR
jgi:branched-chain amino acid transport system ATP-binding protein